MLRKIVSNTVDRLAAGSRARRLVSAGGPAVGAPVAAALGPGATRTPPPGSRARPGVGGRGGGASGRGQPPRPDARELGLARGPRARGVPLPLRPAPPGARRDPHPRRPAELRPDGAEYRQLGAAVGQEGAAPG